MATNAISPACSPPTSPGPLSHLSVPGHLWLGASLNQLRPNLQNLLVFFSATSSFFTFSLYTQAFFFPKVYWWSPNWLRIRFTQRS